MSDEEPLVAAALDLVEAGKLHSLLQVDTVGKNQQQDCGAGGSLAMDMELLRREPSSSSIPLIVHCRAVTMVPPAPLLLLLGTC